MSSCRLDVDVDVGQARAFGAQEALEEQVVFDWVDPADAEQVVHQRAGARAAGRDADVHVANHLGDVGDRQKIGGEFELVDGDEFLVESLAHLG